VAHAYNPSYSGGRDQEDHGLKPALINSFYDPVSKKTYRSPVPQKKKKRWKALFQEEINVEKEPHGVS
jgi:hypothetical protein